jgi:hypothetical protein
VIKSRRTILVGHVALIGKIGYSCNIYDRKTQGKKSLGNRSVDVIVLKIILKKWAIKV